MCIKVQYLGNNTAVSFSTICLVTSDSTHSAIPSPVSPDPCRNITTCLVVSDDGSQAFMGFPINLRSPSNDVDICNVIFLNSDESNGQVLDDLGPAQLVVVCIYLVTYRQINKDNPD